MKVLFLTNIPSPYRVDFFNELGKWCNLTVLFERKTASDRNNQWLKNKPSTFGAVYLTGLKIGNDSALCFGVLKWLNDRKYDLIVIGGYSTLTGMIAIKYLNYKGIPYLINSDGGMLKHDSKLKYRIKKHFRCKAEAWLSTSKSSDESIAKYGVKEENIYRYPFSSLKREEILKTIANAQMKNDIRKKLNINEEKVILTVGQFIFRKGFDVLLKACNHLPNNVGVYIIGGEPTIEYLKLIERYQLENIHFEKFKLKSDLRQYYLASDIFVLPTREDIWGLVINEAMAYGLPIVTTDKCVAGLELVEDYENGFIVPVDDERKLAEKINTVLSDEDLCSRMSKKSLEKIRQYTIENMAERHMEIFEKMLYKNNKAIN